MGSTPTHLRYADWIITVPMLCLQFYLIVKKVGKDVPASLVFKLLGGAYVMLVTGYIGEAVYRDDSVLWGVISTLGYFYVLYLVWFGDINHYLTLAPSDTLGRVYRLEIALKLKEYEAVNEDMIWLYKTMGDFFLQDYLPILNTHFDASKKFADFQKILLGLRQINPNEILISESLIQNTYQMGQFELCLSQVDDILKRDPQNANLLKLKADALFYLNRISESETIYLTLLDRSPSDGDLMADYGHCLLQLERYNDADLWLSKSIKSKNSTPAYAYLGRGIARYNLGKIGVACADWERSLLLGEKSASKWLEKHCQENSLNK